MTGLRSVNQSVYYLRGSNETLSSSSEGLFGSSLAAVKIFFPSGKFPINGSQIRKFGLLKRPVIVRSSWLVSGLPPKGRPMRLYRRPLRVYLDKVLLNQVLLGKFQEVWTLQVSFL